MGKRIFTVGVVIGFLGFARSGAAETLLEQAAPPKAYRWNGGLFLGGHFMSENVEFGNSFFDDQVPGSAFLFGLRAGYVLIPHLAPATAIDPRLSLELEGGLSWSHTDGNEMRPSEFTPLVGVRLHGLMEFWADKKVSPFVLMGAGFETVVTSSKFLDTPDTDAGLHAGIGASVDIGQRTGVRTDFRIGLTPSRDDGIAPLFAAHVGVFYRFGAVRALRPVTAVATEIAKEPDPVPVPVSVPVPEYAPARPWSAIEAWNKPPVVVAAPQPEPQPEPEPQPKPQPKPQPGWSAIEAWNKPSVVVAQQPEPTPAPTVPTPIPGTETGTETGTGLAKWNGVVRGITFANASSRLTGRSEALLDEFAAVLQANPGVRVRISGHTDDIGGKKQNQQLSARRAQRVKEYLVSKGVDAGRIDSRGYGMDKPMTSNDSKEGRARNRRIEFKITGGN